MAFTSLVAFSLFAALVAALPAPPAFKGYVLSTQFRCDDFDCPDWELDISRIDTEFRTKNLTLRLVTLIPEAPVATTNFPVFSAFHEASRMFYVVASPVSRPSCFFLIGAAWQYSGNVLGSSNFRRRFFCIPYLQCHFQVSSQFRGPRRASRDGKWIRDCCL
jgi:hypothetical protein